jgi:hypothetical protein
MANTHEHLEQAEQAEHHAQNPFNQRVAVSMAILAALLAGISMVGHRTHNMVLQLQGDSNRYRTEAATAEVQKSNLFAWYQAKRQRQAILQLFVENKKDSPTTDAAARSDMIGKWEAKAKDYDISNQGAKNPEGDNLPDLARQGKEAGARAEALTAKADAARDEAEHVHHQADRLDIGHLLSEIGLVLCSIALLTRNKAYWFSGLGAAVIAIGLTGSAYLIPREPHEPPAAPSHATPADKGTPH